MFRNCLALLLLPNRNTATASPGGESYCVHVSLVCKLLLLLSIWNKLLLGQMSVYRSWVRKPDTPRKACEGHVRQQILVALAEL
jgi:hypothetical protein